MDLQISNISQGGNQMPNASATQVGVSQNNGEFKQMIKSCSKAQNKETNTDTENPDKDKTVLLDLQNAIPIQCGMNATIGVNLQPVISPDTTEVSKIDANSSLTEILSMSNDGKINGMTNDSVISQSNIYSVAGEAENSDLIPTNRIENMANPKDFRDVNTNDNVISQTLPFEEQIQNTVNDLNQSFDNVLPKETINDNAVAETMSTYQTNETTDPANSQNQEHLIDSSVTMEQGIEGNRIPDESNSQFNNSLMDRNTQADIKQKNLNSSQEDLKATGVTLKQRQTHASEEKMTAEDKLGNETSPVLSQTMSDNTISKSINASKISESFEKISDKITANSIENQIADNIKSNYKAGNNEFVMKLNPENLGTVTVKMAVKNSQLVIDLISNDSKTQSILVSNSSDLKNMLENQLDRPIHVEIVPDDKQNYQSFDQDENQNQNQQSAYQQQEQQENDNNGYTVNFLSLMQLINGSKINNLEVK